MLLSLQSKDLIIDYTFRLLLIMANVVQYLIKFFTIPVALQIRKYSQCTRLTLGGALRYVDVIF
jgi:hypothetical protein